jgi:shikimate dehydrogenase
VIQNDEIFGDNTDGVGLIRDLVSNLHLKLHRANILILGAGGSARGIIGPLLEQEPDSLVIANRTASKAEALAEHYSSYGRVSACRFRNVPSNMHFDLVINATSAGLKGETPPYPANAIDAGTVCYDLSYGLTETPFSRWASAHGAARSLMGWGMLVEQAAESFQLWRGIRPDTMTVLKQIAVTAS